MTVTNLNEYLEDLLVSDFELGLTPLMAQAGFRKADVNALSPEFREAVSIHRRALRTLADEPSLSKDGEQPVYVLPKEGDPAEAQVVVHLSKLPFIPGTPNSRWRDDKRPHTFVMQFGYTFEAYPDALGDYPGVISLNRTVFVPFSRPNPDIVSLLNDCLRGMDKKLELMYVSDVNDHIPAYEMPNLERALRAHYFPQDSLQKPSHTFFNVLVAYMVQREGVRISPDEKADAVRSIPVAVATVANLAAAQYSGGVEAYRLRVASDEILDKLENPDMPSLLVRPEKK